MHCGCKIIRIKIVSVLQLNNQWHNSYTITQREQNRKNPTHKNKTRRKNPQNEKQKAQNNSLFNLTS